MLAAGSSMGELELEFADEPTKTSASRPVADNKPVGGVPDTNQLQDELTAKISSDRHKPSRGCRAIGTLTFRKNEQAESKSNVLA